ncbi:MAG: DUF1345 domain-containing protein [Desulfobaccales bacterium]|jgi:uncharacterized membrane protein
MQKGLMGKMKARLFQFVWNLHDRRRALICSSLGLVVSVLSCWLLGWMWEISFLAGWILWLGCYLFLLGIVIVSADGPMTQERVSKDEPQRMKLMVMTVFFALFGTGVVGFLLTAVGKHSHSHSRLLLTLSVLAVLFAWFDLHTSFGQHYARLYYQGKDIHGRPFQEGMRKGFVFPGTEQPTYLDFLYVAFTVALTYSMSDVNVRSELMRRTVLIHSLVSFFFYSVVLAGVLNAIITS